MYSEDGPLAVPLPCVYFSALSPDLLRTPCMWSCAWWMCWKLVPVCWGCQNKEPPPDSLNENMYVLPGLDAGSPRSRRSQQGWFLLEAMKGKDSARPLSWACRRCILCLHTVFPLCVCLGLNLFFKKLFYLFLAVSGLISMHNFWGPPLLSHMA